MPKDVVIPAGATPPIAPYSPGTKSAGVVYVSGIVALDSKGKTVGVGDIKIQTQAVLESIKSIVEQAGGRMSDITFNAIFLKSFSDYAGMNEVYAKYFPENPPARYCIQAGLVRDEFLVEISSIAHIAD